jgi:hypothetical protein
LGSEKRRGDDPHQKTLYKEDLEERYPPPGASSLLSPGFIAVIFLFIPIAQVNVDGEAHPPDKYQEHDEDFSAVKPPGVEGKIDPTGDHESKSPENIYNACVF